MGSSIGEVRRSVGEGCWQAIANLPPLASRHGTIQGATMRPISFKRNRFPPDTIRHAVWLYLRFTHSIRDVEEPMLQRGIAVSREAIRC